MEAEDIKERRSSSRPPKQVSRLLQSFCMAALGFYAAVLLHQFLVALLSVIMGYDTHVFFYAVSSKPNDFRYWGSVRVIILYALPALAVLSLCGALMWYLLRSNREIKNWYLSAFWFIVFSVVFITSEMTVSPISSMLGRGVVFQGIVIVVKWFNLGTYWTAAFAVLGVVINLFFGVVSYKILYLFRPTSRHKYLNEFHREIIITNFVYPLVLLVPLVFLVAYPDAEIFFMVMLVHALLWVPGFLFVSSYIDSTQKRKRIPRVSPEAGFAMVLAIIVITLGVKIFL